jgi:hypothetical protein
MNVPTQSYLFNGFGQDKDPGPLKLQVPGTLLWSSMPTHEDNVPELAFDGSQVLQKAGSWVV